MTASPTEKTAAGGVARQRATLLAILLGALLLRLSTWRQIFAGGHVYIDGPDGYYHLRRAWLTMQSWPHVPQFDSWLNFPLGGRNSWAPLFDGMLATLALPFGTRAALETSGALVSPFLGVAIVAALYFTVRHLAGARAAIVSAIVAAVLPGVVRYTLVGALDMDPFFELGNVVTLLGIAAGSWSQRRRVIVVTLGLTMQFLGWPGAPIGVAIATAFALLHSKEASRVLAVSAIVTAIILTPFVLTSVWTVASFEGLSILQLAVLAGAALLGALRARLVPAIVISALILVVLLPMSIVPLFNGVRYAAADTPSLTLIAEARPLLMLLGGFDLRPMLIRLGLLPLLAAVLIVAWLLRRRRLEAMPVAAWVAITLTLAMLHSRFSFDAAIALAAFAGLAFEELLTAARRESLIAISIVTLLPCLAAYAPVPTLEAHDFYRREDPLRANDMDRITTWLRGQPPGAVLAPWEFGHWILWRAEKPVVISPFLAIGQSEFAEGIRWFFLDEVAARKQLDAWHVRYVIVTPELDSIVLRAGVAGLPPPDAATYVRSAAARLTFSPAPVPGYREIFRSRWWTRTDLGVVPLIRVYEVVK